MACLALLLLLPGCTDGGRAGDARDDGDAPSDGVAPDAPLPAPTWAVGDWWRYRFDGGSSSVSTRVVTEDAVADWIVETDSPDTAWFDAVSDVSTLGQIRKADLAGSQDEERVLFFRFPLEEGASWDMTWDGLPFTATAHRLDAQRFRIDYAGTGGAVEREVVYDASVRWIASMRISGNESFSAELEEAGHNYTGQVARWTVGDGIERSGAGGTVGDFTVPDEATDVWYEVHAVCTQPGGAFALRVAPADAAEAPILFHQTCPFALDASGSVDPVPGQWRESGASAQVEVAYRVVPRTLAMVDLQNGK